MKKYFLVLMISIFAVSTLAGNTHNKKKPAAASKKVVAKANASLQPDPNLVIYPGAQNIDVAAKQALLIDFNTGKELLAKNPDERMAPSSMTKMMTSYVTEEKIMKGVITENTAFKVSEKAWRTQGSKMFVPLGQEVLVTDLHKGIAIQSGNDAAIVMAEGISGNEELFAAEMNKTALSLGMNNTYFKNASGLHEEGHYSSARDLAKLGAAMIKNHPNFYKINKITDFTYNGIKQGNRNPLLYENKNCDGIKTGHTDAGGYGMVASCTDGDQRYILVVNGLSSMQARADEVRKLMAWATANFMGKIVVKKGDVVEKAVKVHLGMKESIPLVAANDVYFMMLRSEAGEVSLKTDMSAPLKAPVKEGAPAGRLTAKIGEKAAVQVELLAAESVNKMGFIKRAMKFVGLN